MSKADAVLKEVKELCKTIMNDAEPVLDGDEILTDGEEKIYEGRYEVAEFLLNQINKLEREHE